MSQTFSLVLTRRNQLGKSNVFRLMFSEQVTIKEGTTMTLAESSIYNCFKNIHQYYGNNTFSINWLSTLSNFTIPNGGYSIDDLGSYIESVCFNANLYWLNGNTIVYPFSIKSNPTGYGAQIICIPIPSATEVSASNGAIKKPTGASWNFSTKQTAILTLCSPLAVMLGYTNSDGSVQVNFPPVAQQNIYTFDSPSAPDMKSVEGIIIKCNFLNNAMLDANSCDTLAVISNNVSFGDLKEYRAPYKRDLSVYPRAYQYLELVLYDNEYRALDGRFLIDSDITFSIDLTMPPK
jgi:hypothetical protein